MASQAFTPAKVGIARGEIDLSADDIDVLLVMTATSCGSASDADVGSVDGFATLDEFDGTGYARKNLADLVVNQDDANDRAEQDATNLTWSSLGAGSRSARGVLLFKNNGSSNDSASIPLGFIQFSSDETPNGGDFTVQWSAEGLIQIT